MYNSTRIFYVYILTNKNHTVLYVGVTNNLRRRISEHKKKISRGFTSKYNVDKLVYYEIYDHILTAIHREKQLKRYAKTLKIGLINKNNSDWSDLYVDGMIKSLPE